MQCVNMNLARDVCDTVIISHTHAPRALARITTPYCHSTSHYQHLAMTPIVILSCKYLLTHTACAKSFYSVHVCVQTCLIAKTMNIQFNSIQWWFFRIHGYNQLIGMKRRWDKSICILKACHCQYELLTPWVKGKVSTYKKNMQLE